MAEFRSARHTLDGHGGSHRPQNRTLGKGQSDCQACSVATPPSACGPLLFDNASISIADASNETPANKRPPRKLPICLLIAPIAKGPTKPPRVPMELISAIPAAAENAVKNSLGNDQKGA